jgi:GalNAc-alpha-(1->4)-GalNAc-alpha-(1->3)-diNAcBac-PP-undecaprenol alpha-1,4-N-acetyl-D-galactosaminyltransferase
VPNRLYFYVSDFKRGGIEKNIISWAQLLTNDFDICIITKSQKIRQELPDFTFLSPRVGLFRFLVGGKDETLISFMNSFPLVIFALLGKRIKVRISNDPSAATMERSIKKNISEFLKRRFFKFFDGLVVNSAELKESLRGYNSNISLVRNLHEPSGLLNSAGYSEELKILFVGRMEHQKNVLKLVAAFKRVKFKNVSLTIYGGGSLEEEVRLLTAGDERISFLGWCSLIPYESYDVIALPSLYEGSPNALIEALSYGLYPIITPFRSGGRELLEVFGVGQIANGFSDKDIEFELNDICKKGKPTQGNYEAVQQMHSREIVLAALKHAVS